MEILIDSTNKLEIIMKDKDILNISTKKIGIKNQVKCTNGVLYFNNISNKEIKKLKDEKQAIKDMNKYLKKTNIK